MESQKRKSARVGPSRIVKVKEAASQEQNDQEEGKYAQRRFKRVAKFEFFEQVKAGLRVRRVL